MSERHAGSQLSKDVRPATNVAPVRPLPPGFSDRAEWEGFQFNIKRAFENKLLPASCDTAEKAIVIALKGRELGLDPLYALSVLYIVNGIPQLEGEAMLGLVFRKYPKVKIKWVEQTHAKAVFEIARENGEPSQFTFTIEDALRAGLVQKINPDGTVVSHPRKQVWSQYTRNMLMWRAVAMAVRYMFPECIQGILTPDEAQSVDAVVPETVTASDVDSAFASTPNQETLPPAEVPAQPVVTEVAAVEAELLPFERPSEKADGSYMIRFGSLMGKRLSEVGQQELKVYLDQITSKQRQAGGGDVQLRELIEKITAYLN